MVDENGRQTITNDGATVMKVRIYSLLLAATQGLSPTSFQTDHHSSSTLSTPLPESSSISPDRKTPKSVMEPPQSLS
jgi:hypothetical protein